jgi:hypothetical protein
VHAQPGESNRGGIRGAIVRPMSSPPRGSRTREIPREEDRC